MKDKIKRIKDGKLVSEDIDSIAKDIDAMTDKEISDYIDSNDSDIEFSMSDLIDGQQRLDSDIKDMNRSKIIRRVINICAATLIPVTVALSVMLLHFHSENEQYSSLLSQQVEIVTGNGEMLTAALPDGSIVGMWPKSMLTYSVSSFCGDVRRIKYKGEGNFSIAKIKDKSFVLDAGDFEIQVLGTEFAMLSREEMDEAEIYLEEGSIQLTSLLSHDKQIMKPGETAVLSKKNGSITVYDADSRLRRSAGRSTMYFTSATIDEVAYNIELYYGYKVERNDSLEAAYFTGSLPTDDLSQLKYILEHTLKIKISVDYDHKTMRMK